MTSDRRAARRAPPSNISARRRSTGSGCPFRARSASATCSISRAQIGVGPDGKLPEGIEAQTKQTMDNIGDDAEAAGLGYDDVFHCTVFLTDMKNWPAFNKVYVPYFPDGQLPARSAFGANGLALGALLELECQAYAGRSSAAASSSHRQRRRRRA